MSDELFHQVHEKLAKKYQELHPETSLEEALDRTVLGAYEEYVERLAGAADEARMRRKHGER
jgi:hypothetical protein